MSETSGGWRLLRRYRLLLVALLALGGLLAPVSVGVASAEPPPQTNGRIETQGAALRVRAEPTTASQVVGQLPTGSRVLIRCTARGAWVTGTFGTSNVWDNIGPGLWISDAFTFTGSDDPVAPPCFTGEESVITPAVSLPPCWVEIPESDQRLDPNSTRSWCDQLKDLFTNQDPHNYETYTKTQHQLGVEGELEALRLIKNANPDALVWRPKDYISGTCLTGYEHVSGDGDPVCRDLIHTDFLPLDWFRSIPTTYGGREPDVVRAKNGVITLYEVKVNNSDYTEEQQVKDQWIAHYYGWNTTRIRVTIDPTYTVCTNCRYDTATA